MFIRGGGGGVGKCQHKGAANIYPRPMSSPYHLGNYLQPSVLQTPQQIFFFHLTTPALLEFLSSRFNYISLHSPLSSLLSILLLDLLSSRLVGCYPFLPFHSTATIFPKTPSKASHVSQVLPSKIDCYS